MHLVVTVVFPQRRTQQAGRTSPTPTLHPSGNPEEGFTLLAGEIILDKVGPESTWLFWVQQEQCAEMDCTRPGGPFLRGMPNKTTDRTDEPCFQPNAYLTSSWFYFIFILALSACHSHLQTWAVCLMSWFTVPFAKGKFLEKQAHFREITSWQI